jgi:membrane-bound metal-dependent hydrolase YbcI (DUF457 family)
MAVGLPAVVECREGAMANFTTHIAVGTVVSGGLATLTLAADVIAPENLIGVTLAGVLGSVLPDIDLKDSRPARAIFSGLGIFLSFCVLFSVAERYSIAEMWVVWLGTLILVRYGGEAAFHRFSAHRGIWHSILAAIFFWFLTAVVFHKLLGKPEGVAWLAGGFLFVGYVTHLVLDEIYSVDVMDTRIKASFGTALKLYDSRSWSDSAIVAAATVALYFATPSPQTFLDGLTSRQLWAELQNRLLPQDKWFGLVGPRDWIATKDAAAITTGSIASRSGGEGALAPSAAPSPAR